ncbi:MAG: universal stress protein [Comamonadaceae bacterium]|nr:universal stress protein [Comamonadaceae bacterium]
MFKHILVPVDGSATALAAVEKAAAVAKAFGSEVTAIYVIDPYPFTGVGAEFAYGQDQYLSAATAEANAAIGAVASQMNAAGVPVQTRVVESHSAWRGILEAAESAGADLIVMGSHGRRGLEKLVLGSVAQRVLANAKLPVLVVRGPEED